MTPLDHARKYQRRGWQPLPIPHRTKHPVITGWQNLKLNESDLANHFNGKPQNIGVLLGAKSNGLTDIDLDSPEAAKIADYFLPPTTAEFGRASTPRSHRLIVSSNCGHSETFLYLLGITIKFLPSVYLECISNLLELLTFIN